ncbi:COQ9 family protein [Telmatospirillum sp. J64-1]|uniref:COQ9 family protein n=1 Tax=Telmatospirillum sp. J64-1 TaxID=2502183 RepID=UPI00115DA73E|nr:COQ9 family protein [Telmatospirillum sp. J64-1]
MMDVKDLREARDELLLATLPHVPFDGWTPKAMREGARSLGQDRTLPERLFPGGVVEMVDHFSDYADRLMVEDLALETAEEMRLRDRIKTVIRLRLERWAPEREAVRRAATLLALPQNAPVALRATYRTVDTMWYAVGDRSVDFSFYTKRASLAAVFSSTLLYWMEDQSEGFEETWGFLDRRLEDIMRIPKIKAKINQGLSYLPNPLRLMPGFSPAPRPRRFGIDGRF